MILLKDRNRTLGIGKLYKHTLIKKVLDVGCRARVIEPLVDGEYVGLDITPDYKGITPDIVGSFESHSESAHTVVLIDVLEHLDCFVSGLVHAMNLADKYVIIDLPNLYTLANRWTIMRGLSLKGKYALAPRQDRHKWFFPLQEGYGVVVGMCAQCGFKLVHSEDWCFEKPLLVQMWPGLFAPGWCCLLERL